MVCGVFLDIVGNLSYTFSKSVCSVERLFWNEERRKEDEIRNTNSHSSREFVILRSRRAQVVVYVPRGSPWMPAHALNEKWYKKHSEFLDKRQ
jgi:hypothetical protein